MKIQSKTIDLSMRLLGITTEFVGFIPQSLTLPYIEIGLLPLAFLSLIRIKLQPDVQVDLVATMEESQRYSASLSYAVKCNLTKLTTNSSWYTWSAVFVWCALCHYTSIFQHSSPWDVLVIGLSSFLYIFGLFVDTFLSLSTSTINSV